MNPVENGPCLADLPWPLKSIRIHRIWSANRDVTGVQKVLSSVMPWSQITAGPRPLSSNAISTPSSVTVKFSRVTAPVSRHRVEPVNVRRSPRPDCDYRDDVRLRAFLSLFVVAAIAGCGAGAGQRNYSSALVRSIRINGATRMERATNGLGRAGTANIDEARCVQRAGTQRYSCQVVYSYHNSEGTYKYELKVSATCVSGGSCRWHTDKNGALVSAEPE